MGDAFSVPFILSWRKLLQITSALLITNYDKVLLQITTAFFYYKLRRSLIKLRHVFQITTKLLQITTSITNYDRTSAV